MAENKVRFLRGTAAEYAGAVKDDDTFYYTTDDEKFYVGSKEITGGGITVDSELSDTSTNPVQNKVINSAIKNIFDKVDSVNQVYYAVCDTNKSERVKLIECDEFKLVDGSIIVVKFTSGEGGNNPSGNVPIILKINDDKGRTIAYNKMFGQGILDTVWSTDGDMFCNNQTWVFSFINERFICLNYSQSYKTLVGATSSESGVAGIVPAPDSGDVNKFLKGDGTWGEVSGVLGDEYALKSKYGDTTINVGRKADSDIGGYSTAEGYNTIASGDVSHAEGHSTIASGYRSHAEGEGTIASGAFSHAEGYETTASGGSSHAEGEGTIAQGNYSHAGGHNTKALKECEFAHGKFNVSNEDTLFSIGDGTADDARHNAFEITTTGGKLHDKNIATIDDIPTSLPANGGNADYATNAGNADKLDGKHASDFATLIYKGYPENGDCNNATTQGVYSVSYDSPNTPGADYYTLTVDVAGVGTWIVQTAISAQLKSSAYRRTCINGVWGAWYNIADGGNADTVGDIQASDIRQITKNTIQTLPTPPTAEGDYFVSNADSTFPYPFGNLSIRYGSYTAEFVAIYQTTGNDQKMWFNVYRGGWSDWQEIYTSVNKPYIVGDVPVAADSSIAYSNHNFVPSAVFWWDESMLARAAGSFDSTSFSINSLSNVAQTIHYIIFK